MVWCSMRLSTPERSVIAARISRSSFIKSSIFMSWKGGGNDPFNVPLAKSSVLILGSLLPMLASYALRRFSRTFFPSFSTGPLCSASKKSTRSETAEIPPAGPFPLPLPGEAKIGAGGAWPPSITRPLARRCEKS